MTYGKAVLIAADQLVNALLAGWPDETLSSRAWRWEQNGVRSWPRRFIDRLFFWEQDHCYQSYIAGIEVKRGFCSK